MTLAVTPTLRRSLGLEVERGALVTSVAAGSPADRAGIRGAARGETGALGSGGDVLLRVAGRRIESPEDVSVAVEAQQPGDAVTVGLSRGGRRLETRVTLAERPG